MLQPGSVAFGLDLAGMWARAAMRCLPDARLATNSMELPERWDYQSQGASAVLSLHLALKHADPIVRNAPWLETPPPMSPDELAELYRRTEQFRDAFMHLEEKAARPQGAKERAARVASPAGYVALGIYFEGSGMAIYAPVGRTETAAMTRISWDDVDVASAAIHRWALDLFSRWDALQVRWVELVNAWNTEAGFRDA